MNKSLGRAVMLRSIQAGDISHTEDIDVGNFMSPRQRERTSVDGNSR